MEPENARAEDDAGGPGTPEDPPEDLLQRLRSAPAEEILTELFSTLVSTAHVKLGRRDARLFIDLGSTTLEHARPFVSDALSTQVESAVGQLRLGQVTAENEAARSGASELDDLSRTPTPPTQDSAAATASGPASTASGLWVPGR